MLERQVYPPWDSWGCNSRRPLAFSVKLHLLQNQHDVTAISVKGANKSGPKLERLGGKSPVPNDFETGREGGAWERQYRQPRSPWSEEL